MTDAIGSQIHYMYIESNVDENFENTEMIFIFYAL